MPQSTPTSSRGNGLCLLSLDAGGPRSISQLKILVELMHRLNYDVSFSRTYRPCDVFDMIGGTGSGGFIAIFLVMLGLTIEQALEAFIEVATAIFEMPGVGAEVRTAALRDSIKHLLSKYDIDSDTRLMDQNELSNGCKLIVPISYKCQIGSKCTLRNFEVPQEQALNLTIADSLLATLAMPPLCTPTSIFEGVLTLEYISADLTLSNPIREVLSEACEAFGSQAQVACLLSIGCGHLGVASNPEHPEFSSWIQLLERLLADSERAAQLIDSQMGHLGLYHRFCVTRGLEASSYPSTITPGEALAHTSVYLSDPSLARKMDVCADLVRIREGVATLGQLKYSGSQKISSPSIPPVTRTFVMRKGPWEFIEQAMVMERGSEDADMPRMLVVTGIGGCGKTQIILKFMRVHEGKFESRLFIDGSSEPSIRTAMIGHVRSIDDSHSQISFQDCLIFLARPSSLPRLILYDNVDDPSLDLLPLLPEGNNCAIIITSRNRSLGTICPDAHLELDRMSIDESVELLLHTRNRPIPLTNQAVQESRELAEALGCLPIALQQARCYMYETRCSTRAYLERLSGSQDKLLAQPIAYQREMRYLSTYAAFDSSIERLTLRDRQLLWLLSFFHWSNFPLELVILAAKYNFSEYDVQFTDHGNEFYEGKATLEQIFLRDGEWNVMNLDELMVSLQKYSLITVTPGRGTTFIEMHPLAHAWVHSRIPELEKPKFQSAAVLLLALGARNDWTLCAQYLPNHVTHLSSLWDQLSVNDAAAFGLLLNDGGYFEGALKLRQGVVAKLRMRENPLDEALLDSLEFLARTHYDSSKLNQAMALQEEALILSRQIFGEHHLNTVIASNNLSVTYSSMGRLDDALPLQKEVLRLSKERLGDRHPNTITACCNLAATYLDLERVDEAESLQKAVLQLRTEEMGARHPHTAEAMLALATVYESMRIKASALDLLSQAHGIFSEALGQKHPLYRSCQEAISRVEALED